MKKQLRVVTASDNNKSKSVQYLMMMMMRKLSFCFLSSTSCVSSLLSLLLLACGVSLPMAGGVHLAQNLHLETAKQWKLINYNFLPDAATNDVNFYNPMNVLITGLAISEDRIFIATPKLFSGVPSAVSFVPKSSFSGPIFGGADEEHADSPILQAYPDWSFSTTARTDFNCSDLVLVSVYRLRIDSCNRLWILDSGVSRSLEDYEITCPPKILIVDLNTDRVVRRVDFPRDILRGETLFTNLVIDETTSTSGTCDDVFVYISDTVEPGIIVYDSGKDVTWRHSHPAMYPDPDFAESEIGSDRFILMDGVVGLSFDDKAGILYFQPLATDRIFSVSKQALRAGPLAANERLDVRLVGRKSSQGIGLAVSPLDGSVIFSPMTETAIASWNPSTNTQSVLASDRLRLQFIADMSLSFHEHGVLYVVASKFHRFFLKNLNPNEINNRILRINLIGGDFHQPHLSHNHLYSSSVGLTATTPSFGSSGSNIFYKPTPYNFISPQPQVHSGRHTIISASPKYPQPVSHPYDFETVGSINYAVRNPFNALNSGETFPLSKSHRNAHQLSFFDKTLKSSYSPAHASLPFSPITVTSAPSLAEHNFLGYYYKRGVRSTLKDDSNEENPNDAKLKK